MQFNILKRKMDAKIKASLLICCFISWGVFTIRNSMKDDDVFIVLGLVVLILTFLHPYLISLASTIGLRTYNHRITDYEYVEWGNNGLYFRYPDLDIRLDTNISEIKIIKKGYDYLYSFGNNRTFLIPTEKPSEWLGDDKFSFLYLAKIIAKSYSHNIPTTLSGAWKITDIKNSILSGKNRYLLSHKESNLEFSKLCLNQEFLILESPDNNKANITVPTIELSFIYEIQAPTNHYWLNILGFKHKFLVVNIEKNWFVCRF